MSAFRIGSDATLRTVSQTMRVRVPAEGFAGAAGTAVVLDVEESPTMTTADLVQKAADVYTKWIPGDVLAIYLALTAAFRGTLPESARGATTPHAWGVLVACLGLAAGLSLLGALSANLKEAESDRRAPGVEIAGRAVLAVLAFGFWTLTVPGSWWEVKGWDQGVLAAIVFAISIVFALVAEMSIAIFKPGAP